MQATQRQSADSVIGELAERPHEFEFAQAVRLLLHAMRDAGVSEQEALLFRLRFHNSLALAFPPSQIEALRLEREENAGTVTAHVTPAFVGLLGVAGTLPFHYTERVASHLQKSKDGSACDFIDLLSTRFVALAFQAWAKYRVEHAFDDAGGDSLMPLLHAVGGIDGAAWKGTTQDLDVEPAVAAYYAAALRQRPVSAHVIERVLSEYLKTPVEMRQFVGGWEMLPDAVQSRLGAANVTLGESGVAGTRRWRQDFAVRIRLGPLGKRDLERFLPGAAGTRALESMLGLFAVPDLRYEAQLVLLPECIEPVALGGGGRNRQLGWDSFLVSGPVTAARDDVCFRLQPRWSCATAVRRHAGTADK